MKGQLYFLLSCGFLYYADPDNVFPGILAILAASIAGQLVTEQKYSQKDKSN